MKTSINTASNEPGILLCDDGYLRITPDTLSELTLNHLLSGLNTEFLLGDAIESTLTEIAGYTEWVSDTTPVVSISWDWHLDTTTPPPKYRITGAPFSNVMLITQNGKDLGAEATNCILSEFIEDIDWSKETAAYIQSQYE